MKNSIWKLSSIIIIITYLINCYRCTPCYDCPNNLEQYVNRQYYPYEDGEIVEYISSSSISKKDTVNIYYNPPPKEDCNRSLYYVCMGSYDMWHGRFGIHLLQTSSHVDNYIYREVKFGITVFELVDTVDYLFNDNAIKVEYFRNWDTTFTGKDYFDLYLSFDNKLLEYSTKDGVIKEKWYLKE